MGAVSAHLAAYAVIGNPIAHSKSPLIHAAFAAALAEPMRYGRILAPLEAFGPCVEAFRVGGGLGLNVTVPFKEQAFAYAEHLTARAQRAQAVNTLSFRPDGVWGDNTDGAGLVRDIQNHAGWRLAGRKVLLLGAGGAARGVIQPLLDAGAAKVVVANRTTSKAQTLATEWADARVSAQALSELGPEFDCVINATSASLGGALPELPEPVLAACALAYDMMYGAGPTPFLRWARAVGVPQTRDGLGMLVEQAAEAFFVWRGRQPDTAPVLAQLRAGL